jgi:hypothetical protein
MSYRPSIEAGRASTHEHLAHMEERVRGALGGRVRYFQLLRHEHGLVLRGFAHTFYAKQLAQQAVLGATSLPILANEIEVA